MLSADGRRVLLDQPTVCALRDGIDLAVERGTWGGEGAVAEFAAAGATVTVLAVPGGAVRLRVL